MKSLLLCFLAGSLAVWAQPKPEPAVATVNGKKMTAADIESVLRGLPPNMLATFQRDKKAFLQQYALLLYLEAEARKAKIEQASPAKERLAYARTQVLVQSLLEDVNNKLPVTLEDQQKHYEANKAKYAQAKVKVIYVSFSSTPLKQTDPNAKKILTEAEAKAKAEDLVKQIRGGADFVQLVKAHSEDATSAAKDGDFGAISQSDNLPEPVKTVIFTLKKGEVSDPVRQPNGFYIFRVEETAQQPFDKVRDDIFKELKERGFQQWFENARKQVSVTFDNEEFFKSEPPPAAPPKPAQQQ